jgi:hypothetical protein
VVPLSLNAELTADERISMRHLRRYLAPYDKFVLAPKGTVAQHDGFQPIYFHRRFFGTAAAHNRLLYWRRLYAAFADYRFILTYHLDSLVFSDQLQHWCEMPYDYIGAPWMPSPETPWVKEPCVGNGGFTLLRVDAALRAIDARYRQEPRTYVSDLLLRHEQRLRPIRRVLERARPLLPRTKVIDWPLRQWQRGTDPCSHGDNNDYFWSFAAPRYEPTFRVAPVEQALRFAFEVAPRRCQELNGGQLPFGCHAWTRYDRAFWEPHLLPDDDGVAPRPRSAVVPPAQSP